MARIKIKDLPKDMKISGNELTAIRGGVKRGPTGIIIESGGSHELEQHMLWAPISRGLGVTSAAVGPGCVGVGRRY